jgi:hypothetical protein
MAQRDFARRMAEKGFAEEARNWLRRAAMAGDTEAKFDLGKNLLAAPNDAHELAEGVAVTVSAANDGEGDAAYRTAVLAAGAIGTKRSWNTALVYLQRAAELGSERARKELVALSADSELGARALAGREQAPDVWKRLRMRVDFQAQIRVPHPKVVSVAPRIAIAEKFLDADLCDALVQSARARLEPIEGGLPASAAAAARLAITDFTLRSLLMLDRVAEIAGLAHRGMEAPAIIRFAGGVPYPDHLDYFDPADPAQAETIAREGQRAITFLVYLNDDYEGGETEFPSFSWRHKGRKGDALFWWNVGQDGEPDPATRNASAAVTRGEKWIFSQWIRVPVRQQR